MGVSSSLGKSNTVFGSKGASSFLFKLTIFLTTLFFTSCLLLSYLGKSTNNPKTVSNDIDQSISSQYDYLEYKNRSL